MGKQADIYAALKAKAEAVALALDLPAAIDDASFTPPYVDGDLPPFLRFDFFNNAPFWRGLREERLDQGLLQVNLVVPNGYDRASAYAYVDQIIALYPNADRLPGAVVVKVQGQSWVASPIVEADRTTYPVTVSWVC
jgi:hypothetical protein